MPELQTGIVALIIGGSLSTAAMALYAFPTAGIAGGSVITGTWTSTCVALGWLFRPKDPAG